jgi:class 3 adenylate cyclase/predicted ATPase
MDIGGWLRSVGLEQYEATFRENAIDSSVLRDLTEDHLREMGLPLGVRLKLLKAINALSPSAEPSSPAFAPPTGALPAGAAERRQVTVMFSDLVGSTALAARMDPEDLREIISAYQICVADTVQRYEGFVARYMGDGVLVHFGYPRAHEDDAERAVRAGLELITAVGVLKAPAPLQTRIGIATGLVVVGELIGSGDAQERSIVGTTPSLAARLQGLAKANMVVICDATRRLLGNLFELEDLGPQELKGITEPTRPWAAVRESTIASRFEALRAPSLSALVGRDEECELLLRRWSTAKSGQGQVVLLSGEAGIGKSRLTAALLESLPTPPHMRLRFFCSPQHTDSAFYPIIGEIERAAGLVRGDTPQAQLDKLDAMLAQTSTPIEDAALLADLLSLPNDGRYPAPQLSAEQRRERTLDALVSHVHALSCSSPVLMIFEDAHWSDPTSLEAFGRIVDRIATFRALLIVTFRPDFDAPWIGQAHVTVLSLNRLTQHEVAAMIDHLVGNKELPAGVRQDIVERTDGIPLFVEEMTKAVIEAGSESALELAAAAVPFPSLPVPASLHASLMARLDRLGPAKEVAQIGAAIGRSFSHTLLAAVACKPDAELQAAIDRLVDASLLFRQGVPPQASYMFKHALVQDAAYGSLLRASRRVLHARIVETLETQFTDIAERQPELLARHCTEADLIEKAAALWGRAGLRSLERSALVEATEQLTRALAQIVVLPMTPALRREQIQLQVALITPLMHVKGYAAPETKAAAEQARLLIEEAEAIGEPPEDPLLLFSVLHSFWTTSFVAFKGEALRELASQFLALAEKRGAVAPLMIGHRIMGSVLHTGAFAEGRAHLDRAIALYDPAEHRPLATRFGQDVRVAALSYRSWALWMLGYPQAALADAIEAVRGAREIGQAATLMYALVHAWLVHFECGDYATADAHANELLALAEAKGTSFWNALGASVQGCVLARTGKAADAVKTVTSSITALRSTGSTLWTTLHLPYLARAYAELGQFEYARSCIHEAVSAAETSNERWHEAEIYRIGGEIELLMPQPDRAKAEANFEQALEIARAQEAKSWELRAAMSMAQLWRDQGKRQQSREYLAPLREWFREGFDTQDLKQAKALLEDDLVRTP